MLTFFVLLVCIVATVITDYFGEPPSYLVGLLGTAAGAFFAAVGSDKQKRDIEVAEEAKHVAQRAEAKADTLAEIAVAAHPDVDTLPSPPFGESTDPDTEDRR